MNACFADSFFFLALLAEDDDAHEIAVHALSTLRQELHTTTWILTEVADAMSAPANRLSFLPLLQFLREHPKVVIVPTNDELFTRGVELFNERPDKAWSLTDCISFVVMQERGITEALTGDHHFEQAGFVSLMKS